MFKTIARALIIIFWPMSLVLSGGLTGLDLTLSRDQTVFSYDYEARQEIIRNGYLYPTVWMSRMFQNKLVIYWQKYKFNFFALADPNNYFFGFHPREIILANQNLQKYPFVSIIFFAVGLYTLPESKKSKLIGTLILGSFLLLSLLLNFDRYDFILYFPMTWVVLRGFEIVYNKTGLARRLVLTSFFIFSTLEVVQLFARYRL